MKITSSSSFLLATLAISSSSSTLAAPAEHGSVELEQNSVPSSSSLRTLTMVGRTDGMPVDIGSRDASFVAGANVNMRRGMFDDISGLLGGLPGVGSVLGPMASGLFHALHLDLENPAGVQPMTPITPEQFAQIRDVVKQAHEGMEGLAQSTSDGRMSARRVVEWDAVSTSTYSSYASDASSAPYNSTSTAMSSTGRTTSAPPVPFRQANADTPSSAAGNSTSSGNGTSPTSPPLPLNPPNTPVTSILPKLPPVNPPHPPVAARGPPMFSSFRAADVSAGFSVGPGTSSSANATSTYGASSTAYSGNSSTLASSSTTASASMDTTTA